MPEPTDVRLAEATRTWAYVGVNSFGGPAGQISVMHRVVVDERQWIGEKRFLHALNFCMLLPGPEAMQLAVYIGWLVNGVAGAVVAGVLFVLPGLAVMAAVVGIYASFGDVSWIAALLFGIQAAVVAIVVQAVVRVASRSLRTRVLVALATTSFLAVFLFDVPFPFVVGAALAIGWVVGRMDPVAMGVATTREGDGEAISRDRARTARRAGVAALVLWVLPLLALVVALGTQHLFSQEAWLFSKTAVVSFGGAYAALAYVTQQAVTQYGWVEPRDMVAGLGLAETTPGPLVLVMTFVGYLAAYRAADELGLPAVVAGVIGLLVAAWATFLPSFGFVLLGAPSVEKLRHDRRVAGALAAVTACVVGVIADLGLWFATNVFFTDVGEVDRGPFQVIRPVWESVDLWAVTLALAGGWMIFRLGWGVLRVLGLTSLAGLALGLTGLHPL
jgi:chromate transporter